MRLVTCTMEQSLMFYDAAGRGRSATLTHLIRKPGAELLCHGFMGFKESVTNRTLGRLLVDRGVATLRFDFFGHGRSEGTLHDLLLTTLIGQAESALAFMPERAGFHTSACSERVSAGWWPFWSHPHTVSAIPRAPLSRGRFSRTARQQFGRVAVELWRRIGTVPASIGQVPVHGRFYDDCLQYDAFKAASALSVRTLIVHGERDELIPVEQVRRLVGCIPVEKELHVLPGADHRFSSPSDLPHDDAPGRLVGPVTAWMTRSIPERHS